MTATETTGAEGEALVEAPNQPKQPHLAKQDASSVDATKLTALTPEVVRLNYQSISHSSSFSSWAFFLNPDFSASHN